MRQPRSTEIQSFTDSINEISNLDLYNIEQQFITMEKKVVQIQDYLTLPLNKPDISLLKDKSYIACDGSCIQQEYEHLTVSVALGYVFSTKNNTTSDFLTDMTVNHPKYSSLLTSIVMKNLEYRVAFTLLKKFEKNPEKLGLCLLDGAISYPDEAIGQYTEECPALNDIYLDYIETGKKLFNLAYDLKVPIVGIIKHSISSKYLLALKGAFKLINEIEGYKKSPIEFELNTDINHWFKGKNSLLNFSESAFIFTMLNNILKKSKLKTGIRTRYIRLKQKQGLQNPIPIQLLKDGNLSAFYYQVSSRTRPFFCEFPSWITSKTDLFNEFINRLNAISYYSIQHGYPQPLIAAHKKVELSKKKGRSIIQLAKREIIHNTNSKVLPKLLNQEKYHPSK